MFKNYNKVYNQVINMLLKQAEQLSGADGTTLEVPEDNHMTYRATSGILSDLLGYHIPLKDTFSGMCMNIGQPQMCSDIATNPNAYFAKISFSGKNIGSMLLLPIIDTNGVTKAVLRLASKNPIYFNEETAKGYENWLFPLTKSIAAAMTDAQAHAEKAQMIENQDNKDTLSRLHAYLFTAQNDGEEQMMAFQTLTELIVEGVFLADIHGKCLYTNKQYQEIRDMTDKEMLGDGWKNQIEVNDLEVLSEGWEDVIKNQTNFIFEFTCISKEEIPKRLRVISMPLKNKYGIFGYLGIVNEIPPVI